MVVNLRTNPPFLSAKITRPKLPEVLQRRRLFRLLKTQLKNASLWVEGPAGYGKTTLVNSYLEAQGIPCLWYRFDERDGEISNFFYYLSKAAEAVAAGEDQALSLLTPEYLLDIPTFTRNFFEQLYDRLPSANDGAPLSDIFTIVFDDYHLIASNSPLHDIMKIAVSELTGNIRLIFLSRRSLPPTLAALQADRQLVTIDSEDLRLTEEETRGIVRHLSRGRVSKALIASLHERAQGWVAGLILLWELAKKSGDDESWRKNSLASIQGYFADTIFDGMDEKLKDFLLKTALLPFMTIEMAARLTGCNDAARILERLHRDNFFTEERHTCDATYLYHALFREFLLARLATNLTEPALTNLQKSAGTILEEAGYGEQAAVLFQDAQDWESLAQLVIAKAQDLLLQGRGSLLESWLTAIPERRLKADPWLQYWLGCCRLYQKPHEARVDLEVAYRQFERAGDHVGQYLTCAAIIDCGMVVWDLSFFSAWIATMERLLEEAGGFPSPDVEMRVTTAMFMALMLTEPWYDKISDWVKRLENCIRNCPDDEQNLCVSMYLIFYYGWIGRLDKMTTLLGTLRPLSLEHIRTIARLYLHTSEAYRAWLMTDWERCEQEVDHALKISDTTGVRVLDAVICAQGCYGTLGQGNLGKGRSYLDRMQDAIPDGSVVNRTLRAHYYYIRGWYAALQGKGDEAIRDLRVALEYTVQDGSPFPSACNHVDLALLLIEADALTEAVRHLQAMKEINLRIRSPLLDIKCRLVEAHLAWKQGQEAAACMALRQALGTAREQNFVYLPWWQPQVMAALCVKALEHDIEPDYVRELVLRHELVPATPPVHLEDWPWAMKVYTLGRFAVIRNGEPLRITGKAQKMPLALLKILIALGGRAVSEATLSEALWPAAEAESAHSSFATTLSRLRRLLGDAQLLQVNDGRLSLDPNRCWVDAWSFERVVGEVTADRDNLDIVLAERALHQYNGAFLPDEDADEYVVFSARERLREKYLRLVERLGTHYVAQGRCEEAAACFEKGLEVDDLVEAFYWNLMSCYDRLGQRARAMRLYERCRRTLSSRFGVAPSREMEVLYQSMREREGEVQQ